MLTASLAAPPLLLLGGNAPRWAAQQKVSMAPTFRCAARPADKPHMAGRSFFNPMPMRSPTRFLRSPPACPSLFTSLSARSPPPAVFVADSYNHRLKALQPDSNSIRTLAGSGAAGYSDGQAAAAQLSEPGGLALGPNGERRGPSAEEVLQTR